MNYSNEPEDKHDFEEDNMIEKPISEEEKEEIHSMIDEWCKKHGGVK